jgi:hypothetical protein
MVGLRLGALVWIVCARQPGRPYQHQRFGSADEAGETARALARVLCPAPDAVQDYYFNTQHFSR